MIYLPLLSVLLLIIFVAVKVILAFLLIKIFRKETSFKAVIKRVFIYELGLFFFYLPYPVSSNCSFIFITSQLVFACGLFVFLMQKGNFLSIKKSLIIFVLVFLILTPALSFFHHSSLVKTMSLSVIGKEMEVIMPPSQPFSFSFLQGLIDFKMPLSSRIISKFEDSLLESRFVLSINQCVLAKIH